MAEPFLGEIKFFSFNWPPKYWALCNGSLLPIAQNQALFSLLGTTFGGNGVTTFALPDLRGRVPMHPNGTAPQGVQGGVENVTLNTTQIPMHNHAVMVSSKTNGAQEEFENAVVALGAIGTAAANVYAPATAGSPQPLTPNMVSTAGGTQAHTNCQPSLVGNYCIALNGIYPSRN
jgi:microcystin-dependent protein